MRWRPAHKGGPARLLVERCRQSHAGSGLPIRLASPLIRPPCTRIRLSRPAPRPGIRSADLWASPGRGSHQDRRSRPMRSPIGTVSSRGSMFTASTIPTPTAATASTPIWRRVSLPGSGAWSAGSHHKVGGRLLGAYAAHAAWLEDHRGQGNGALAARLIGKALAAPVSRTWKGYWRQRVA